MARFIESCNLPVVVLGLGAQAELGTSRVENLPEGSLRFLKAIGERSHGVGVRGAFTAQVLADHGVDNAVIMGCPSNFISPKVKLGVHLENERAQLTQNSPVRVAVYSQLGRKNFDAPNIDTERQLFDLVRRNGYHYVHNFPAELIDYVRGGEEVSGRWKNNFRKIMLPKENFDTFDRDFRRNSHAFSSVESWMEFSSTCDMSIGKRVHGCLNTIQSGTFSTLIYHDERTRELAETLGLPTINIDQIEADDNVGSLINKTKFSGELYDEKRKDLFREYTSLWQRSGIENVNALLSQGFVTLDSSKTESIDSKAIKLAANA